MEVFVGSKKRTVLEEIEIKTVREKRVKGTKGKGKKKKEKLIKRKRKRERFKSMKIGLCLHWIQIMSDVADVAFFRSSKKKRSRFLSHQAVSYGIGPGDWENS